jgi:hypothetical protein
VGPSAGSLTVHRDLDLMHSSVCVFEGRPYELLGHIPYSVRSAPDPGTGNARDLRPKDAQRSHGSNSSIEHGFHSPQDSLDALH